MRFVIFAVITVIMAFTLYVYPIAAMAHLLFGTAILTTTAIAPTAVIALILFAYMRTHMSTKWLSGFTHYGMGIGFLGFCNVSVALLVAQIIPAQAGAIGLITLAVFALLCGISLINGRRLHHRTLTLTSAKITEPIKIAFISDVHLGSNSRTHLDAICQQLRSLTFSHLFIGGDLFDSSAFQPTDLAPLTTLDTPIYFVTGNHEYYVSEHAAKLDHLSTYGITSLHNETVQIGPMNVIGISDNQAPALQADIAARLTHPTAFNLLLVHQPSIWDRAPESTDLMISGHTHNGQIFPFNYLVRLQFKTVYGLFKRGASHLYVSSGSGTWGPRMRLGSRNEIVHVTITPA